MVEQVALAQLHGLHPKLTAVIATLTSLYSQHQTEGDHPDETNRAVDVRAAEIRPAAAAQMLGRFGPIPWRHTNFERAAVAGQLQSSNSALMSARSTSTHALLSKSPSRLRGVEWQIAYAPKAKYSL